MTKGKSLTVDDRHYIGVLRALGLSATAIAAQVGCSVRTVQRVCREDGVSKGELGDDLVQQAREAMSERVLSSDNAVAAIIAHLVDESAHVRVLREKAALAFEDFNPKNNAERALFMRTAAAYSTVLKNTSDIMRRVTDLDRFREDSLVDNLPELVIRMMDEDDVEEIRASQREEAKNLGYIEHEDAEEVGN